jgi:hypothetical protein
VTSTIYHSNTNDCVLLCVAGWMCACLCVCVSVCVRTDAGVRVCVRTHVRAFMRHDVCVREFYCLYVYILPGNIHISSVSDIQIIGLYYVIVGKIRDMA